MRKYNKIIPALYILVALFLSCDKDDPVSQNDNLELDVEYLPNIELIRVDNTLAKSVDPVVVDFDTVFATKSLNYMVVNNGTVDAFNVTFSSKAVITTPKVINSLPVSEGGDLGLLPILTITMPHGLPPSGIGPPLPIERGIISDSLIVHYQYLGESADTLTISKSFIVHGIKVADVLEIEINGIPVEEHPKFILYLDKPGTPFYDIRFEAYFDTLRLAQVKITNKGDFAIYYSLLEKNTQEVLHPNMNLLPDSSFDLLDYTWVRIEGASCDTVPCNYDLMAPIMRTEQTRNLISVPQKIVTAGYVQILLFATSRMPIILSNP